MNKYITPQYVNQLPLWYKSIFEKTFDNTLKTNHLNPHLERFTPSTKLNPYLCSSKCQTPTYRAGLEKPSTPHEGGGGVETMTSILSPLEKRVSDGWGQKSWIIWQKTQKTKIHLRFSDTRLKVGHLINVHVIFVENTFIVLDI